ncbi:MAG: agmatinase [Firmicutes bacterium]|nr:agmatinase [Bacillota bacterium]
MSEYIEKCSGFMGSRDSYAEARAVILGVPLEVTVSFRPGTRFGPQQIRTVSYGLEEYSPYQDRDLNEAVFYDAGDLALPLGNLGESLNTIESAASILFTDGKLPVFLGGEHLVSLPLIKAAASRYPDLCVIHFDAHADLRPEYLGQPLSHATVMRRVTEVIDPRLLYQFGIRSGTREEFEYARQNTNLFPFEVLAPLTRARQAIGEKRPVYLSIDIDVVDPAFAPGTGTPEPAGISSRELLQSVDQLKGLNIVAIDLVEVSPPNDRQDITSVLAAKVIREAILGLW